MTPLELLAAIQSFQATANIILQKLGHEYATTIIPAIGGWLVGRDLWRRFKERRARREAEGHAP